jgi:hypothetical protein
MARLILRQAKQADHGPLESLMRATEMGSRIRIGIERDPDYFAGARIQVEEPWIGAAFDSSGNAAGMFSAGTRRVWLGTDIRMRYLSDLRIHPDWQGSSLLARGFRMLRNEVFRPGEWAQSLVLEGNPQAFDLLTSRRGGLPEYRPAGRYLTWLLPAQRVSTIPSVRVRSATSADLGEMQTLLNASTRRRSFGGIVNLSDLGTPFWRDLTVDDFLVAEGQGGILGLMGLWNQCGFQQLRVRAYPPVLAAIRPVWNTCSRFRRGVILPPVGGMVPLLKATAIACHGDDPSILRAMLAAALTKIGDRLLLLGLSARDPLVGGLQGLKARKEYGRHFLVGWDGSPPPWNEPFSFDAARI